MNNFQRALELAQNANTSDWDRNLAITALDGPETKKLAMAIGRNEDTVRLYHHAGHFLLGIEKHNTRINSDAPMTYRELAEKLGTTRAAVVAKAWAKFEFHPQDMTDYALQAVQERISVRELNLLIREMEDDKELPPEDERAAASFIRAAKKCEGAGLEEELELAIIGVRQMVEAEYGE